MKKDKKYYRKELEKYLEENFELCTPEQIERYLHVWMKEFKASFPVWTNFSSGEIFIKEEFLADCGSGKFTEFNGVGYWSNGKQQSNIYVNVSEASMGVCPNNEEFTHVVWYK